MKTLLLILAIFSGVALAEITYKDPTPCDGDGPVPLKEMPFPKVHVIETDGEVQEFLLWSQKDSVVYRNGKNNVNRLKLADGSSTPLTTSTQPIAKITDAEERFILTRDDGHLFDAENGNWYDIPMADGHVAHAYWRDRVLYSVSEFRDPKGRQRFVVNKSDYNWKWTSPTCQLKFKEGVQAKLARGHNYPQVYLYTSHFDGEKSAVTIYRASFGSFLGVFKTCDVEVELLPQYVDGEVEDVYLYPDLPNTVVAKVKHAEKNLFWKNGAKCRYFQVGDGPVPLSYREPLFAQWREKTGLQVLHLNLDGVVKVSKGISLPKVEERHLTLSEDLQNLFVVPPKKASYSNSLLRLEFEPFK